LVSGPHAGESRIGPGHDNEPAGGGLVAYSARRLVRTDRLYITAA
jgi:hypothetical protein